MANIMLIIMNSYININLSNITPLKTNLKSIDIETNDNVCLNKCDRFFQIICIHFFRASYAAFS